VRPGVRGRIRWGVVGTGFALLPGLLLLPFPVERGEGAAVAASGIRSSAFRVDDASGSTVGAIGPVRRWEGEAARPVETVRRDANPEAAFDPGGAPYPAAVDGVAIRFEVQAVSVLAGESLLVEAPSEARLLDRDGVVAPEAPGRWRWTAPGEAGIVPLRLEGPLGDLHLNVLVMRPMEEVEGGVLNGYPIGRYLPNGGNGDPTLEPPVGFVEVPSEDEGILVSPHFTLGQFLCKEPGDPRYMVLTDALLVKLEAILEAVNAAGHPSATLHVMSGFRTPAYNRAIGNTTDLSRHLWGDAADIFVDNTGNGMMDDLNGDGRVDDEDARILMRIVEQVEREHPVVVPGGLSLYRTIPGRGPFVHVDARGVAARW